jgi:hypothetical protein
VRGDRGNVGIIRSPIRATILPDLMRRREFITGLGAAVTVRRHALRGTCLSLYLTRLMRADYFVKRAVSIAVLNSAISAAEISSLVDT